MRVYIEAYDGWNNQVLGNLDGQAAINVKNYRRTKHYKALPTFRALNNYIKYYHIVTAEGQLLESVRNETYTDPAGNRVLPGEPT